MLVVGALQIVRTGGFRDLARGLQDGPRTFEQKLTVEEIPPSPAIIQAAMSKEELDRFLIVSPDCSNLLLPAGP
jgi:hypothetical protein